MYYKTVLIVNDDSRVIIKLETSLTDDVIVANYDCHMFLVQATGLDCAGSNYLRLGQGLDKVGLV
jgi:hypothetical protein